MGFENTSKGRHMQFRNYAGAGLLALAMTLTACGTSSSPAAQSSSPMSSTAAAMTGSSARSGNFSGLNDKHVSGMVSFAGGQIVLSGFSSDPGPDLHIYLTTGS